MTVALTANIGATDTLVHATGVVATAYPYPALIDSELVLVRGGGFDSVAGGGTYHLQIDRAQMGSAAAAHNAAAAITPVSFLPAANQAGGSLFSSNAGLPGAVFVTAFRLDTTNKHLYAWDGAQYVKVSDYA